MNYFVLNNVIEELNVLFLEQQKKEKQNVQVGKTNYFGLNDVIEELDVLFMQQKQYEREDQEMSEMLKKVFARRERLYAFSIPTFEVLIVMDKVLEDVLEFNQDQLRPAPAPAAAATMMVEDNGWGWYVDLDEEDEVHYYNCRGRVRSIEDNHYNNNNTKYSIDTIKEEDDHEDEDYYDKNYDKDIMDDEDYYGYGYDEDDDEEDIMDDEDSSDDEWDEIIEF